MSNFSVVKYNSGYKSVWDNFVANSKNGTFLFQRDFIEYHKDRFVDYSLLVFKDKKVVALLPANIIENQIISHQGLTYGGLLLSTDVKFSDVLSSFNSILKFLNNNKIEILKVKLTPKTYHSLPSDEIDYLLFKIKANKYRCDVSSTIELNGNLVKMTTNRKRNLKKAIKEGVSCIETQDLTQFWDSILKPNLLEKHNTTPVHSLEEITKLKALFPNNIKQFNAFYNNKIIAGVTVFETKTVAHAQYISTVSEYKDLRGLDLIFDYLINDVYKNKKFFDFGISNENEGNIINKGLLKWKESFGARAIVHDFYEVKTSNYYLLENVII